MSACRHTTTPTSWPARSCGGSGRLSDGAMCPPSIHGLDYQRGRRDIDQAVENVDDVMLTEIDDAHRDGEGPGDESNREPSIPAPGVEGGQRWKCRVERWEGGELVGVEVRVKRRHPVVRAPELVDRLVEDLVHGFLAARHARLELIPRRSRWPEQVGDEGEHRHEKQGGDEAYVVIAAADPEEETDDDRQWEVHEVEEHRQDVLGADDIGAVERVLEGDGRQRSSEQRTLQAGEVVGREARLSGVAAHRLVGEEQQ